MKKITTLFVAGISIFAATQLMSCKKDEDKKKEPAGIVGSWKSQTISYKATSGGVVIEDTTEPFVSNEITFNADKSYATVDLEDAKNNENGTYTTNAGKLYTTTTKGEKDTIDYTVSATQFTVFSNDVEVEDGVTNTFELKINFVRK